MLKNPSFVGITTKKTVFFVLIELKNLFNITIAYVYNFWYNMHIPNLLRR